MSSNDYAYPLDVNVNEFVTIKLSRSNYFTWRSMMLSLIQSHGLRGFIYSSSSDGVSSNDDDKKEEEEIDEKDEDWRRRNELLRGWMISTIDQDLLNLVQHLRSAKQVWITLEENLSQPFLKGIDTEQTRVARNNITPYMPLAKAALNGDWEKAKKFFNQDPDAVRAIVTGASETALMVAARSVNINYFIKKLVRLMTPADLAMVDYSGSTALHMAARAGNTNAAKLLVNRNPRLPNIPDNDDLVPLHIAVLCGKKEMVLYLFSVTKENEKSKPFEDERGRTLLSALIASGFYDIALMVVQRFPELIKGDPSPLQLITRKDYDFKSGAQLNLWQYLIYSCVPIKLVNMEIGFKGKGDIEDASDGFMSVVTGTKLKPNLFGVLWKLVELSVPLVKHIRDKKLIHYQALQFVKYICKEIVEFDYSEAVKMLRDPLHLAASIGVHEIVEEILESFPSAAYLTNMENQTIFHIAIKNRRENVFNIIYQFPGLSHIFFKTPDVSMNTGLHLAALLGDHQRQCLRTCAVGPALQMQRELQWFQEVEKLSLTMDKQRLNNDGKTPAELFNETHQELMKEGEQWMKGTSSSCTIVAALVVTIVFAAAITVPGGNKNENGLPFFSTKKAFIIFAISNALALFSSTSSLLLFLSIQSSHFSEQDFLSALPKRLICGFLTLFLSILFMMIAFASTLQIEFGVTTSWILLPVIGLACIPVTLFASLQFPRLIDMVNCTYGSGNFCKQSDRPLF